ncbi:epidermal growth factor receptor substrate 15-like 1 isoform X2 [Porites lutea]|uniref:epidermal growth factor receptor substrate 15-like 1 isoform X1 n=1 Tax=Porites lutea TaxID=51062 RepID=UPI003CC6D759
MAAGIPTLSQLSAGHATVYESFFRQADVSNTGQIGASDAAAFLKKSGLKEGVLHKIWELADPQGTGFLDKQRFFLALRLIALAQNGKDVSLSNLTLLVPAPKVELLPPAVPPPQESTLWAVKAAEKAKYDNIFEGLKPVNGLLPGDKVKPVLLNSKLPIDVLGRVWELADIDKDGMLDNDEFAVAMHLVYRALEGDPVPLTLHGKLIPPSKRKLKLTSSAPSSPSPQSHTPPSISSSVLSVTTSQEVPWVVTSSDKSRYDTMFKQADKDADGLVSGEEVKNIFMASGLPQQVLAHIWGLCDVTNQGRLNSEQFSLAMYLIHQKVMGVDPPQTLSAEMVPPSMRNGSAATPTATGEDRQDGTAAGSVVSSLNDFSAIKELDKISKEIEELGREKANLQREIEEKEDMIRQRNGEIQNLQTELEKTKVKYQELEKQKADAQSKLDELDKEKAKYEEMLKDAKQKCDEETKTINSLQAQIASSRQSALHQEEELSQARDELNKLREDETKLEREIESSKEHLEAVQKQIKSVQTELSQVRSKVSTLEETNNSLNANIAHYNSLMNSNSVASGPAPIPDFTPLHDAFDMTPTPSEADAMSVRATAGSSPVSSISGFSVGSGRVDEAVDDFKDSDPFKSKENLFSSSEAESNDPFHVDDPFKTDPFHYKSVSFADPFTADPFEGEDLFKSDPFKSDLPARGEANGTATGISNGLSASPSKSDPFAMDPFQSTFPSSKSSTDNFFSSDPFKPSGSSSDSKKTTDSKDLSSSAKDPFSNPFGSDPFAS